jgi:Zn ribbon nucleic-acid-binding protein
MRETQGTTATSASCGQKMQRADEKFGDSTWQRPGNIDLVEGVGVGSTRMEKESSAEKSARKSETFGILRCLMKKS